MAKKDKERKRTTSCGAVAWRVHEGKTQVLLIKQFAHKENWGIPKGHVNDGEKYDDCARRETREETGVEIVLGEPLPDVYAPYKKEKKTVKSWLARPAGNEEPTHDDPDSEVADARWFAIDELPQIVVYQRPLVAAAVERLQVLVPKSD